MCLEKFSLDLQEEKEYGCNWDDGDNIRTSFGHTRRIMCLLRRLAEGILTV